jgi:hypothetical protein
MTNASANNEKLTMWLKGSSVKVDYTETDSTGTTADTESTKLGGKINGFEVGAAVKVANGLIGGDSSKAQLIYSKNKGNSDYVGSIIGSGLGYGSALSTTKNDISAIELNWLESKSTSYGSANLRFGIGNRLWERTLSAAQKENYEWKYWHAGLGFDFIMAQRVTLGLNMRYQRAISPEMKASGTPINATFKLGTTDGYKLEIPMSIALTKNVDLIASYAYDYWNITASNVVGGYYEPDSKTENIIASLGVAVRW